MRFCNKGGGVQEREGRGREGGKGRREEGRGRREIEGEVRGD
jgi:hypothetical protein